MTFYKLLIFLLFTALYQPLEAQTFSEIAQSAGIDHLYYSGMLIGGGAAFFDYDNDGLEDLYIVSGGKGDRLYHNLGNGQFEERGILSGIRAATRNKITTGVITGDVDNDGHEDIFVTTMVAFPFTGFIYIPNILFHNEGDGTFTDVSATSGITEGEWSVSASFGDYNLDGYLDLYVGNYLRSSGFIRDPFTNEIIGYSHVGIPNFFYINNGDGTFRQEAAAYGINDNGLTLAVAFTDYDNDGDMDIYSVNDFGEWTLPNALFRNEYPVDSFTNVGAASGAGIALYGMGVAIGDYDEDQDLDYYVTNIGRNVLLQQQNNQDFIDVTDSAGVANTYADTLLTTGWGTQFLDYDNDTYLDLFVANGEIGTPGFINSNEKDPCKLYKNNADGTFTDVSIAAGVSDSNRARGSIHGDFDNDGDLDLVVVLIEVDSNSTNRTLFFRNDQNTGNHWLKVKLRGTRANRNGYGSRVILYSNGRQWIREIDGGSSHASSNSSIAHFGLGAYTTVDSLVVIWPGGDRQVRKEIGIDQQLTVVQDIVTNVELTVCVGDSTWAGGAWQSVSGIYIDTLVSAEGLDSTVIIHLQVLPVGFYSSVVVICEGDSIYIGDTFESVGGVYADTFQSVNFCYTIEETLLIVKPDTLYSQSIHLCTVDSFYTGGAYQSLPGVYYDTLPAYNGCDSVIQTDLSVGPKVYRDSIKICEGDSVWAGGAYQSVPGLYCDTLLGEVGCDSVVMTWVEVRSFSLPGDSLAICFAEHDSLIAPDGYASYLWLPMADSNKFVEVGPGQYQLVVTDIHGCRDTSQYVVVERNNLSVFITPDTALLKIGESIQLTSAALDSGNNLSYQWFPEEGLDCTTCENVLFTPLTIGSSTWRLVVTDEYGCTDTAYASIAATDTVTTGLWNNLHYQFKAFPNPVDDVLHITYHLASREQVNISISNLNGKRITTLISQPQSAGDHSIVYNMYEQEAGVYLLSYKTSTAYIYTRIAILK